MGKVKVQSKMREVRVQTVRDYVVDPGSEKVIEVRRFRQFHEHECYMAPDEAKFIVEDRSNQMHAQKEGQPHYWYPLGIPVLQDDDFGGESLLPPLTEDHTGLVDPQVAQHAYDQQKRKEDVFKQYQDDKARAEGRTLAPPAAADGAGEQSGATS